MSSVTREDRGNHVLRLAVVLPVLLVFGRVVGHALLTWDDLTNTLWNPHLVPPSASGLLYFWGHAYADLYVPLTFTLWGLLASLSTEPWIFHAASVALASLAALAAFGLLRRLVRDDRAAAAGALLFAIHPVQVESVAWMSGSKDLLCGLFSLLALGAYVDAAREEESSPRRRALVRSTFFLVLALLSKPSAVALPLLALALDVGWLGRRWSRSLRDLAPWIVIAFLGALVANSAQPAAEVVPAPIGSRPLIAADALAFYARKILLPANLAPDYGRDPNTVLAGGPPIVAALAVAAAALALALLRRRERDAAGPFHAASAAAALSVAAVAPVLGLVSFDFQRYSTVADHYLYVAMLGPALLLAWLLARDPGLPLRITAGILLLAFGWKSFVQAGIWRDDETLWRHTLAVNPRSWTGHGNLGQALQSSGRSAEALSEFESALALNPDDARTHYNLGTTLDALDRTSEALIHLEIAVHLSPEDRPSRENLGIALLRSEQPEEAEVELRKAIEIEPRSWLAHYYLAGALDRLGRTDEMLEHLKEAVRLNPHFQPARDDLQAVLKARAAGG